MPVEAEFTQCFQDLPSLPTEGGIRRGAGSGYLQPKLPWETLNPALLHWNSCNRAGSGDKQLR